MRHLRNPANVLNSLKKKATDKNYHYERLYRNFYNKEFYLQAYQRIYANSGNMTPGADGKTIDGMSVERIDRIISKLKDHSYKPNPARRTYIKKKNGKLRPLGIPSIDDKLIQEVMKQILESIFEPTFSNLSHGFRPNRSCHTALMQIQKNFIGTKWFIEGDIKSYFDTIDHHTLVKILRGRINDEHFIGLVWKFLKAGYLEKQIYHNTYSGTPQGSIISPILSNIYLNEFDNYVDRYMNEFKKGKTRMRNPEYRKISDQLSYWKNKTPSNKWETMSAEEKTQISKRIKILKKQQFSLSSVNHQDENFKRLQYVRYADDWLCGVIGSKAEAEKIKADFRNFLQKQLHLELSEDKTLITNARERANFLGYEIFVTTDSHVSSAKDYKRRQHNAKVKLYVPRMKWQNKLIEYRALKIKKDEKGKEIFIPTHRPQLINYDDLEIFKIYNAEIRGLYNYYRIANNACVIGDFYYVMKYSLIKTLAAKHKSSTRKIIKKYGGKNLGVSYNTAKGIKTIYLYNEGFKRNKVEIKNGKVDNIPSQVVVQNATGLLKRLEAKQCEWCGAENVPLEIHHVKKLKDLKGKAKWERVMIGRRRKTMALCKKCHHDLHNGKLD